MADRHGSETIYHPTDKRDGDTTTHDTLSDPINNDNEREQMVVKLGILGDQYVGKSSFMRRYVNDEFTQNSSYGYYTNSPGSVLFLEKHIAMKQVNLFLGLWCSTTYNIYESTLQLVCTDANVIIFMFSLTNKQSLHNIKSWYEKALTQNKSFIPILVGTKYDIVTQNIASDNPKSAHYLNEYHTITKTARKYAMKMKSSLIYISSKSNININHVIKVCVAKVFNIKPKLREYHWNTLKALREHHVSRLLKCWGNHKKMKYLIHGYIKENIHSDTFQTKTKHKNKRIISLLIQYILYDLPHISSKTSTHSSEGKKKKSKKKRISTKHTKISNKSKKNQRKSSKKKKRSKKRSHKRHKVVPQSPIVAPNSIHNHFEGYQML